MSFANSNSSKIYSKRKWQRKMQQEAPCRHEVMKAENGFMVCQACGYMRLAKPWEDVGKPPDWQPQPRMENGPTDF